MRRSALTDSCISSFRKNGRRYPRTTSGDLERKPLHCCLCGISYKMARNFSSAKHRSDNYRALFLSHHFLRVTPFATPWFHPKILRTQSHVFLRDGVHLNFLGNHLLYHSYQKALMYCLSRNRNVFPNSRPFFIGRPRCNLRP